MSSKFRRLFAGASTVILFVIGIQLLGTAAADAHTNIVTGVSQCTNGTYTVTWTISNNYTKAERATATAHTPAGSTLAPPYVDLPAVRFSTNTIMQSGIAGSSTSASLTVSGKWTDGLVVVDTGSVQLAGTCLPNKAPTAPTYTNGGCSPDFTVIKPTLTIPSDAGVTYAVNGVTKAAGTYEVPAGTYTVTASSTAYVLSPDTWGPWQITEEAGDCLTTVTPVNPTVVQSVCAANGTTPVPPSVTLPTTTGIAYQVSAGPYDQTHPATVTATLEPGYEFAAVPPQGWTLSADKSTATFTVNFAAAPTCTQSVQAAKATFTVQQCLSGKTLKPGSYTVPTSTGVNYLVNGKITKAGTYTAKPRTTVTVVAQAQPGYTLSGTSRWSFTYGAAKQCSNLEPTSATRTPSSSASNSTSHGVDAATTSQPPLATTGAYSSSLLTVGVGLLVAGIAITMLATVTRRRAGGPRH